jgi:uncharacterized protein YbaP (TraB family)
MYGVALERSKVSDKFGLDNYFMAEAKRRRRMKILHIETSTERTSLDTGYSLPLQVWRLEYHINNIERSVEEIGKTYNAWKQGDAHVLREYAIGYIDMPEDLYEEYVYAMHTRRNIQMVEAAERYMAEGKNVFFVVGVAHMVVEGSIVDMLKQKGYSVEKVEW